MSKKLESETPVAAATHCSACGGSGMGKPMYRPEIDKVQRDRCYYCQGTGIRGGNWDVQRTHGRLAKVEYDAWSEEAKSYCAKLRAQGWKTWSIASDGRRITEVFYLPYTNTNHGQDLPSRPNADVRRDDGKGLPL
jgi:hypothetical protein